MEELIIEGKTYLSSKRAAKVTGYAKDYIGQLCREGRVEAKLVGRSWYVYQPSIEEHRFNDERTKAKRQGIAQAPEEDTPTIQAAWAAPSYTHEPLETLPPIEAKAVPGASGTLSEMQSAWQDWFSAKATPKEESPVIESAPELVAITHREPQREEEPPVDVRDEPEAVPVRMIVSDIAPVRTEAPRRVVREVPLAGSRPAYAPKRPKQKPSLVARSLTIAFALICLTVTAIATGIIDEIHVGGISNSSIVQFLQGSKSVDK